MAYTRKIPTKAAGVVSGNAQTVKTTPKETARKAPPRIVEAVRKGSEVVKKVGKKVIKKIAPVAKEVAKQAISHGTNLALDYASTLHPAAGLAITAARHFHKKAKEAKAHEKSIPK